MNNHALYRKFPSNNLLISFATAALILASFFITYLDLQPAFGVPFLLRVEEEVYSPGETLIIYGAAEPDDVIVVRLYDPSGRAVKIDNVRVDDEGFFREGIFSWPEPSRNLAFGTYVVEAISSTAGNDAQRVEVAFAGDAQSEGPQTPKIHVLGIKLDSPNQVTVNENFRIFVQLTFDGALVNADTPEAIAGLLGSSHVHSGRGNSTLLLSDKFIKLHEGLYYTDVNIGTEGTYIIHAVAFYNGFLSHDSKVISATVSSISTVQESVSELAATLDSTNQELGELQAGLDQTRGALNDTKDAITDSVSEARTSIRDEIGTMQQASGQFNSILLPVLALISVIIALQISLFARIRASYR